MAEPDRFDTWESFFYPGTQVMKNKDGFRDAGALKDAEYGHAALRQDELQRDPIPGNFDFAHLRSVHAYLFQDVYAWAGQVREVAIAKGQSSFSMPDDIATQAQMLDEGLRRDNHLQGLAKTQFVDRLATHYAALNALHPFREGNGRSSRVFLGQLAINAGFYLDRTRFENEKERWNKAASRSMPKAQGGLGDLSELKAFFTEAVRPARAVAFERMPENLAMHGFPELAGAFKELHAAENRIAAQHPNNPKAQEHFLKQARSEIIRRLDAGGLPGANAQVSRSVDPYDKAATLASDAAMRAQAAMAALARTELAALAKVNAGQAVDDKQRAALEREGLYDAKTDTLTDAGKLAAADYEMRHAPFRLRDYVAVNPRLERDYQAPSVGRGGGDEVER